MKNKLDWKYPHIWTTFNDKIVDVETIDHQHLSNTYWYCKIINNASDESLLIFVNTAKERFNGQLLPYRPHVDFKDEIDYLYKNNFIRWENPKKRSIVYNGNVIGEINQF